MTIKPPPTIENVVDQGGKATLPWLLFFQNIYNGDQGVEWTPNFVSLTSSGTMTFTGRYYRIGRTMVYFRITITTTGNSSATAGTTYIDNFPLDFTFDGTCNIASNGLGGTTNGHIVASNNRIFVPAWTTISQPLVITGYCEAN